MQNKSRAKRETKKKREEKRETKKKRDAANKAKGKQIYLQLCVCVAEDYTHKVSEY